jgi:CAAX protease family protein
MVKISPGIRHHPLLAFTVLTFAISWGGIFVVIGRGGFAVDGEQSEVLFSWIYLSMLAGPSIAGMMLTAVVLGRTGLRDLASRMLRWCVSLRWYAAALLIAPLVITAVLVFLSSISLDFLPRIYTDDDKRFLLQFSIIVGILVGFFEELGWTGFAVHTVLKQRSDALSTGLIVGFLFGAWNLPVVYLMSGTPAGAGDLPLAIFLPATLFTWLPTYRVLMVWVYDRTKSLLLAMLMYASLIAFWRILTPLTLSGLTLVTYYLIFSAVMWVIIAVALKWQTMLRPEHA